MNNRYKALATSFTTTIFLVISITGILMFFHLFDNYTKELHEIMGLVFVVVAIFHVVFNWKSMKNYFTKKVFIFSIVLVSIVSMGFIFSANTKGENPKTILINSLLKAPLENSVIILETDMQTAIQRIKDKGYTIDNANSISEISKLNKVSPSDIVKIISNK